MALSFAVTLLTLALKGPGRLVISTLPQAHNPNPTPPLTWRRLVISTLPQAHRAHPLVPRCGRVALDSHLLKSHSHATAFTRRHRATVLPTGGHPPASVDMAR